jgi:hypothetical protein
VKNAVLPLPYFAVLCVLCVSAVKNTA